MEIKLPSQERRIRKLEIASIIIEIIALIIFIIVGLVYLNNKAGEEAYIRGYDAGYDNGWNAGFDDCIQENNLYDNYDSYKEPATDAEIWETYHDCNMYGLPEYAKPYCEKETMPNT